MEDAFVVKRVMFCDFELPISVQVPRSHQHVPWEPLVQLQKNGLFLCKDNNKVYLMPAPDGIDVDQFYCRCSESDACKNTKAERSKNRLFVYANEAAEDEPVSKRRCLGTRGEADTTHAYGDVSSTNVDSQPWLAEAGDHRKKKEQ